MTDTHQDEALLQRMTAAYWGTDPDGDDMSTRGCLERVLAVVREHDGTRDSARIDFLEVLVNEPGGILLHDGSEINTGRRGIGLRPGAVNRSLRTAIDDAMGAHRFDRAEGKA